jgi:hypothetical protein
MGNGGALAQGTDEGVQLSLAEWARTRDGTLEALGDALEVDETVNVIS